MFFKNKKKLDSRIRFQNPSFKNRLTQARGYKRPQRIAPKTDWEILLNKVGLGSWLARFLSVLGLIVLVYIVYVPNFLFIKHITINGAADAERAGIEASVNSFLGKKLPWPQKNLLLLSKSRLADYLIKNNRQIMQVNSVSKKLFSTLVLNITPRVDEFIIQTQAGNFTISNDGQVTGQITTSASGTLPSGLSLIKLDSAASLTAGQQVLSQDKIKFIEQLQTRLPAITKSQTSYLQIEDLETPDLSVYMKNGFKALFDLTSDPGKTLSRLELLLSQLADADFKKLFYVDMRFEDKGYSCYKGTPCVKDVVLPNNRATGTIQSLTN